MCAESLGLSFGIPGPPLRILQRRIGSRHPLVRLADLCFELAHLLLQVADAGELRFGLGTRGFRRLDLLLGGTRGGLGGRDLRQPRLGLLGPMLRLLGTRLEVVRERLELPDPRLELGGLALEGGGSGAELLGSAALLVQLPPGGCGLLFARLDTGLRVGRSLADLGRRTAEVIRQLLSGRKLRFDVGQPRSNARMRVVRRPGAGLAVLKPASNLLELGRQRRSAGRGLLHSSLRLLGTRSELGRRLRRDDLELGDPRLRGLQPTVQLLGLRFGLLPGAPSLGDLGGESLGVRSGGLGLGGCLVQPHLDALGGLLAPGELLLELRDPSLRGLESGPKLLGLRHRLPTGAFGFRRVGRETLVFRSGALRLGRCGVQLGFDGLQLADACFGGVESIAQLVDPAVGLLVCTLRLGHLCGEPLDLRPSVVALGDRCLQLPFGTLDGVLALRELFLEPGDAGVRRLEATTQLLDLSGRAMLRILDVGCGRREALHGRSGILVGTL